MEYNFNTATDYYCPACGKQTVAKDELSDDYYGGCPFGCISCGKEWHFYTEPHDREDTCTTTAG